MFPRFLTLFLFGCFGLARTFAQPASAFVSGVWCGNVSPTSASVVVRTGNSGQKIRLAVSRNVSLSAPAYSGTATTAVAAGNTVTVSVQGLVADTDYYYGVEVGGVLQADQISRGRFHTFPLGRGSFKIAFASCGDYRAGDQTAYDAILAEHPLLFINTGDLHYHDTNSTNPDEYRQNYDAVLNQPNQAALYRSVPVAYMWDDHDFCGNDSDGTSIGRDAARLVYRERVPHYPIAAAGGTMAQAFTVGRVRVIMTDLRSASDSSSQKEAAAKSRLGNAQKSWFKQELISARDSGFPIILWVSTTPWIGPAKLGDDAWAGYAHERTEIADFLRDNRITNVVLLAGDMHALAYDDGTHSDYATGGGAPLTVLQASALTQAGDVKGGPYTGGALVGSRQYGIMEVYDSGGPSIACRFLGMKAGEGAKLSYIFSGSTPGAEDHALVNISSLTRITPGDDTAVSGFVISGRGRRTVLVRAVGPTLASFGVPDVLARPRLALYQGTQLIATNEAWAGTADAAKELRDAFDRAGAFRLMDENSSDAAMLVSLTPGVYSLQVKSADAKTGATLIEIYDVP